jgi:hypothetical protein
MVKVGQAVRFAPGLDPNQIAAELQAKVEQL